jgi:hypothetical protein
MCMKNKTSEPEFMSGPLLNLLKKYFIKSISPMKMLCGDYFSWVGKCYFTLITIPLNWIPRLIYILRKFSYLRVCYRAQLKVYISLLLKYYAIIPLYLSNRSLIYIHSWNPVGVVSEDHEIRVAYLSHVK